MNTPDCSLAHNQAFSIAELEARFEMQAAAVGGPRRQPRLAVQLHVHVLSHCRPAGLAVANGEPSSTS